MDNTAVDRYFEVNSNHWIGSSYDGDGYTFPTALARTKKACSILEREFHDGEANVADLGCGGGHLGLKLVTKGFRVTGVDGSKSMLEYGSAELKKLPESVKQRLTFVHSDVLDNGLSDEMFDAVTALGVIGYLPVEEDLFREAFRILKPGGIFMVSCRNRLFNLTSITNYTRDEISAGGATDLTLEIEDLFQDIPEQDLRNYLTDLASVSYRLATEVYPTKSEPNNMAENSDETLSVNAKQHTPKMILAMAEKNKFKHESFHGIHPHLLMAGLNRNLPPFVFNALSSSLDTLSHLPVSLIWSSGFIGVFRKTV